MLKRVLVLIMVCAVSTSLIGCSSLSPVKKGMAFGAGLGAAVGLIWGSHAGADLNAGEGMAVGAVTGATVGALVGDQEAPEYTMKSEMKNQIDLKDSQIASAQEGERSALARLSSSGTELGNAQRRVTDLQGQVTSLTGELQKARMPFREITLLSDVLFQSGSDVLSDAGKKALDEAAEKVKAESSDHFVQIEGHTDTDPIRASSWKTNWELGVARSLAVLHHLVGKGVAPEHLSAATFSQYHPVTGNDSAEGKSKNRRSVIVIWTNWPRQ